MNILVLSMCLCFSENQSLFSLPPWNLQPHGSLGKSSVPAPCHRGGVRKTEKALGIEHFIDLFVCLCLFKSQELWNL